jgi:hypothetical protein
MQSNLLSERRRTAELPSQSLQGYYQGDLSGVFDEPENVTKPRTATWQFVCISNSPLLWGITLMRSKLVLCVALGLASAGYAKEPKHYQSGKLLQMDSVRCGTAEKDAKSLAGEMLGTDSGSKKTQEVLCQEYVLQTDKVIYRIRPRDEKHPVLLPVGEQAQFRMQKDKMLLSVEDLDGKEREYLVVSMTPRSDSNTADASASTH